MSGVEPCHGVVVCHQAKCRDAPAFDRGSKSRSSLVPSDPRPGDLTGVVRRTACTPESLTPLRLRLSCTKQPVAGDAWIAATRFRNRTDAEVGRELLARVHAQVELAARGEGRAPVVVWDLDYTAYDNDPRMLQVLHDWADHPESIATPEERRAIRGLTPEDMHYLAGDCLREIAGEERARELTEAFLPFFLPRFLGNEYTQIDPLLAGAREMIESLVNAGAVIAFVTGRAEPAQGDGTRAALARDGMAPDGERFHLFLKPFERYPDGRRYADEAFKTATKPEIDALGEVVGTLDNEPENVVAYARMFPNAMNVFVNSRWSNATTEPGDGLWRIDNLAEAVA